MEHQSEILSPFPQNRQPRYSCPTIPTEEAVWGSCVRNTGALNSKSCSVAADPQGIHMPPCPTHPTRDPDTQSHTTGEVVNRSCKSLALPTFSEALGREQTGLRSGVAAAGHSDRREAKHGGDPVPFCTGSSWPVKLSPPTTSRGLGAQPSHSSPHLICLTVHEPPLYHWVSEGLPEIWGAGPCPMEHRLGGAGTGSLPLVPASRNAVAFIFNFIEKADTRVPQTPQ